MQQTDVKKVESAGESQGVKAQENRGQRVQELGEERTGGGSSKRVGRGRNRGNYATFESHDANKALWGIIYVLTIKLSSLHVRQ